MEIDCSKSLVIGVFSRALFDLSKENDIFARRGLEAYKEYQEEHEDTNSKVRSNILDN